jgi:hypothetical protein
LLSIWQRIGFLEADPLSFFWWSGNTLAVGLPAAAWPDETNSLFGKNLLLKRRVSPNPVDFLGFCPDKGKMP